MEEAEFINQLLPQKYSKLLEIEPKVSEFSYKDWKQAHLPVNELCIKYNCIFLVWFLIYSLCYDP